MSKKKQAATPTRPAKSRGQAQPRKLNLDDIEQAELTVWARTQLERIRTLVEEVGDEEMLNALDFLAEDNERWADPELEAALSSGKFKPGTA